VNLDTKKKFTQKERMQLWLGKSIDGTRVKNDFYETPPNATQMLLDKEDFDKTIWECSCGKGAISEVLIKNNYDVVSHDLIDRGYGTPNKDFLLTTKKEADSLITNPPYGISVPFWRKCIELDIRKYAFLLRITWLEGRERSEIFKKHPFKRLYVFSKRIQQYKEGKMLGSPMLAFGWFVWEKGNTDCKVDWI
jgi:hypothetical protein